MNKGRRETLEYIQEKEKEGMVSFMTFEGLASCNLEDFVKQPADGMLYDLNRDKVTVLTASPELRWINDYAVAVVINYLMSDEYKKEITKRMIDEFYEQSDYAKQEEKDYPCNVLGVVSHWLDKEDK